LTKLYLDKNQIADLKPLASIINLTTLEVRANQINVNWLILDLSTLPNSHFQISDLQPLADLHDLVGLILNYNKIIDISPLATIGNLSDGTVAIGDEAYVNHRFQINLADNQIRDIKPLNGLINSPDLNLTNNPIRDKVCPIPPVDMCGAGESLGLPAQEFCAAPQISPCRF
jgi:internalin A